MDERQLREPVPRALQHLQRLLGEEHAGLAQQVRLTGTAVGRVLEPLRQRDLQGDGQILLTAQAPVLRDVAEPLAEVCARALSDEPLGWRGAAGADRADQHRRKPGADDARARALRGAVWPGCRAGWSGCRELVRLLKPLGALAVARRARRGEGAAQLFVGRFAAHADLLGGGELDRVGAVGAADGKQLRVRRPGPDLLIPPVPVIDHPRRLAEAVHQRQLAFLERPRVLGVHAGPAFADLRGDVLVRRLSGDAVDLQRRRVHVENLVVVPCPGASAKGREEVRLGGRKHIPQWTGPPGPAAAGILLARFGPAAASPAGLVGAVSGARPQHERDDELAAWPRELQRIPQVVRIAHGSIQEARAEVRLHQAVREPDAVTAHFYQVQLRSPGRRQAHVDAAHARRVTGLLVDRRRAACPPRPGCSGRGRSRTRPPAGRT